MKSRGSLTGPLQEEAEGGGRVGLTVLVRLVFTFLQGTQVNLRRTEGSVRAHGGGVPDFYAV